MKILLYSIVFIFSLHMFSQADNSTANTIKNLNVETNSELERGLVGNLEKSTKDISGSYHLFKGWNNHGLINSENGKSYTIKNVNFNIRNHFFEYKNEKGSIVGFDLNGAEIIVNSRKFKSFYFHRLNKNKVVEIVYEDDSFTLLRDYNSEVKSIKPEGYKDFSKDQYIVRKSFFLRKNNQTEKFKLSKKNILNLLDRSSDSIEKYVKQHKLSYRKDEDLRKIFNYYRSLKKS